MDKISKEMLEALREEELNRLREAIKEDYKQKEVLLRTNTRLSKELNRSRKTAHRMTVAAIYYEETYSRLSPELKAEFDRIGQQVINDLNLGGMDNVNNKFQQDKDCGRIS